MALFTRLQQVFVKEEFAWGLITGTPAVDSFIDENNDLATQVRQLSDLIGLKLVFETGTYKDTVVDITAYDDATKEISFSPSLAGVPSIGNKYHVVLAGSRRTTPTDNLNWMFLSGTADAGSDSTSIVDPTGNTNGAWVKNGFKVGYQVWTALGSAPITAINYSTSTISVAIAGLTTGTAYEIRPTPIRLAYNSFEHVTKSSFFDYDFLKRTFTKAFGVSMPEPSEIKIGIMLVAEEAPDDMGTTNPVASFGYPLSYAPIVMAGIGGQEILTSNTSVKFTPVTLGLAAITVVSYEGGSNSALLQISNNCRSSAQVVFDKNKPGIATFTFKGNPVITTGKVQIQDALTKKDVIYTQVKPILFNGVTATFDDGVFDYLPNAEDKFTFNIDNNIISRPAIENTSGYGECLATKRDITCAFNPDMSFVAAYPWHLQRDNVVPMEFRLSYGNATQGYVSIGSPDGVKNAVIKEITKNSKEGDIMGNEVTLMFGGDGEDGELELIIGNQIQS